MGLTITEKLIAQHLVEGIPRPGADIALRVDQTLTQDATGTLVMLSLEAMQIRTVQTKTSVQYVDHSPLKVNHRNPEDHVFLQSACARFGLWFSPPGGGISHPVHMLYFGVPGESLLGSDSHTCAAGGLAMLAIGAGGLDVALAIAGEPFWITMPEVLGVHLKGRLPPWVSAKDVILEMLRRHGVAGGAGRVIEYFGPGVATLSVMDRHVIAAMGAELGATTSVFPADEQTLSYLRAVGREDAYRPIAADDDATFAIEDVIDLSTLQPLIALPSSPGNVVPVTEVLGRPIHQAYIGSSANPGYRDFAIAAEIVRDRTVAQGVALDINPSSRELLSQLARSGHLDALVRAGARIHQVGCIDMEQAPGSGRNCLRTAPRNFPGGSGTAEDRVFLCSPETAAASALRGVISDPRDLDQRYPVITLPLSGTLDGAGPLPPPTRGAETVAELDEAYPLVKGENIWALPELEPLPDELDVQVALAVADDVSTDEIMPAGSKLLAWRNNIERIAELSFLAIDESYVRRAKELCASGGHAIVAGLNYGQGSSREYAALAPRILGLRLVIAQSYARLHFENLVNYGILPLCFQNPNDANRARVGQTLRVRGIHHALANGDGTLEVGASESRFEARLALSKRQRQTLLAGGPISWKRQGSSRR